MSSPSFVTVTDLFCGAGGSSTGAVQAGAEVRLAMNHWQLAIETHNTNHPHTDHVLCDVSATDPRRYPKTTVLIASPECTNHSLAKGKARPRYNADLFGTQLIDPSEERSRATMWDVVRFAEHHQYEAIIVENVVDARSWVLYDEWLAALHKLGYATRAVYLNTLVCHPTPQSRDRLYVVCWQRGNRAPNLDITPRSRCARCGDVDGVQTWKRAGRAYGRYGANGQYLYLCPTCGATVQPYYYPALTAIDWALPIQRIGDRAKPLQERTLARIRLGLERFKDRALVTDILYSHAHNNRSHPVSDPWPTQTGQQSLALVGHPFIAELRSHSDARSVTAPLATMVAGGTHHGLTVPFLHAINRTGDQLRPVTAAYPTQTASLEEGLTVPPAFLTRHYTQRGDEAALSRPVSEPTGAITTQDHHSLTIPPAFLASYYGTDQGHGLAEPAPTIPTVDRHGLVALPFIASQYTGPSRNAVAPVSETLPTIPAMAVHYLAQPGPVPDVEDCGFRMLEPHEIQAAMAFPGDYQVLGNKRERVKQLGNAVCPPAMRLLVERVLATLAG